MKPVLALIAISAMLALSSTANASERARADVSCQPTDDKLVYDCMIMLVHDRSGDSLPDAKIMVKAEMPSMPMAHNVAPVEAMAMGKPGSYHARIKLEMQGEWVLTMDISGPLRDRLVEKLQFGDMGTMKHDEDRPKSD